MFINLLSGVTVDKLSPLFIGLCQIYISWVITTNVAFQIIISTRICMPTMLYYFAQVSTNYQPLISILLLVHNYMFVHCVCRQI